MGTTRSSERRLDDVWPDDVIFPHSSGCIKKSSRYPHGCTGTITESAPSKCKSWRNGVHVPMQFSKKQKVLWHSRSRLRARRCQYRTPARSITATQGCCNAQGSKKRGARVKDRHGEWQRVENRINHISNAARSKSNYNYYHSVRVSERSKTTCMHIRRMDMHACNTKHRLIYSSQA